MRRIRRAFVLSTVLAGGLFGCELIVSNTVPDFKCTPGDPNACPSNMACDPTALVCVDVTDGGGFDTGSPDAKTREAGPGEAGANFVQIGERCTADSDCQDGLICGTSNTLTTTIATSSTDSICTKTCCTSADCPDNFVCYGAGTGGNYCISTDRAQRGAIGTGLPGDSCTLGTDCRSGVCDADDSRCLDTCCAASDCSTGTTCRVKSISVPPPALENWVCAVPETGAKLEADAGCSGTTQTCKNDNCSGFPAKCRPTCCSSAECVGFGFGYGICAYGIFTETGAQTKWCFDAVDSGTLGKTGDPCSGVGDCASRFCDPDTKKCAPVCCQDSDCDQGQACRPAQSGTPFLRCVSAAAQ